MQKYLSEKSKIQSEKTESNEGTVEQLSFVFEVVRHGARPPCERNETQFFPKSPGMLTPEGMRQRYLLGRYNRERYTQKYKFLSDFYDPKELFVQSTDVNRTIQSGYSELMGLYPPGKSGAARLSQGMIDNLEDGVGMPPFKVRDAKRINT